jgi:tRNA-uridine 2-sulfurtransferase
MSSEKKIKGIGLLSGGLDSVLAYKVLEEQGVEVAAVIFSTPFFGPPPDVNVVSLCGIPARVIDFAEEHLEMVKKPVYGYGSQMNPCIDCHALMLRTAGRLMLEEGADFLFTGEVLGQRPMSQRRDSMRSVEKLSGYPGRVLRPLSARLLPQTLPESEGLIDREKLLDIQGRSRKRQEALAIRYGLTGYAQPGGGCLLTKEGFAGKLKTLLELYPEASSREAELLTCGRHFRTPAGNICAIGRNRADNDRLTSLSRSGDLLLKAVGHTGPTGLVAASPCVMQDMEIAAMLVVSYGDAPDTGLVDVSWRQGEKSGTIRVEKPGREKFLDWLL